MIEVIVVGGAVSLVLWALGRGSGKRKQAMEEAARLLGGRAAAAGGGAFELRASVLDFTVTLRARGQHAAADTRLEERLSSAHMLLAKGRPHPQSLGHVPRVEVPRAAAGYELAQADDAEALALLAARGRRALEEIAELPRTTAVWVLIRGGHLEVGHIAPEHDAGALVRLCRAAAELSHALSGELPEPRAVRREAPDESGPTAPTPAAVAALRCEVCGLSPKGAAAWVRCRRCATPYHRACFAGAGSCVKEGCDSEKSDPLPEWSP